MKKYLIVIIFLAIPIGLICQDYLSSEQDFKNYIINHIEDYDQIVGIYNNRGYIEKYMKGEYVQREELPISDFKFAIIRKGSSFYEYTIPAASYNYEYRIITPTTTQGTYLRNGNTLSFNSSGILETCRNESPEMIAKLLSTSVNLVTRMQIRMVLCQEFIKTYPTEWDWKQAIKEQIKNSSSSGTGFALSTDGFILTNYHVVENAKSIKVKGINGDFSKTYNAEVAVTDVNNDLAIIKVSDSYFNSLGIVPYTIKNISSEVGESVFVLGYPLTATMGEEIKLTTGIISSKSGFQGNITTYQTTAAVQSGNSGAPMFDKDGNIIGIINSKHTDAENAGYAIKTYYLQNLIEALPVKLELSTLNQLKGKDLSEQVKITKNFIYLLEIN